MTSLPLTQKPTDIVLLLTSGENLEFLEILAKTEVEDIPQLEESQKVIQKLPKISQPERDYRTKLLQQRLEQLLVIQNFQIFEEEYKDYKAHFSINGRGILIKIISHDGHSWEKQTQTFINFQASREFQLTVNEILIKDATELVQKPTPVTKPQSLSENQQRWQILNLLVVGDRVLYKGRIGTYKGVQESATPSAWVFFDDSQITEPVNPLDLTPEKTNTPENLTNNDLTSHPSSKLNLGKVETLVLDPYTTLCHPLETIVDFNQIHKENFLRPITFSDSTEKSPALPFQLPHLEKTAAINSVENLKQLSPSDSYLNSKIIPFRPRIVEGQLSKEETERILAFINSNLSQLKALPQIQKRSYNIIRHYLVLLDEGKGYEQLGFKNMTALLNSKIIQGSRSNLQKQWQAGRIERDCLGVEPGTIPEDHCRKLAVLKAHPEQVQKAYAHAQELAGDGQVTAKLVQQAVQEIAQNQGIELPLTKLQKKISCNGNQDFSNQNTSNQNIPHYSISSNERHHKVNFWGIDNFSSSHPEVFVQLETIAKKCNSTPENIIVQGLVKLVAQSTKLSDSEVFTKAIEVALAEIKLPKMEIAA